MGFTKPREEKHHYYPVKKEQTNLITLINGNKNVIPRILTFPLQFLLPTLLALDLSHILIESLAYWETLEIQAILKAHQFQP